MTGSISSDPGTTREIRDGGKALPTVVPIPRADRKIGSSRSFLPFQRVGFHYYVKSRQIFRTSFHLIPLKEVRRETISELSQLCLMRFS
jgi:hypothetical protein